MHELAYTQSMIDQIESTLAKETFNSVKSVNLKIGKLSGIEPTCLDFCFETCAKGTIVEGAKLHIDIVPCKIFCNQCKKEFTPDSFSYACPECLKPDINIINGQEIELMNVEVE